MEKVGVTSLYLAEYVVQATVYQRRCLAKRCIRIWNGENECIFRLSNVTCAGWEMGYNFVVGVNKAHMTFSGFVAMVNQCYKRASPAECFMCVPTFINWWFAWASAMKVDFRQGCSHCGPSCVTLVGDGTKIGTSKLSVYFWPCFKYL